MAEQKKQKKKYASTSNPTIEAVAAGHFRFSTAEQAQTRLEAIRDTFIISRLPDDAPTPPPDALRLWIRGYAITEEEKEKGYTGNYALLRVRHTSEDKYTLTANKLPTEKRYHPQRKRTKSRHPNWGHPILRSIQKGKIYPSLEETQAEILRLHEEYPEISIPCTGKMYIMIYQKTSDGTSPVKKWVLEVKPSEAGGFYFECYLNTYAAPRGKKETGAPHTVAAEDTATLSNQPDGYFTSMVQLKRARKKKAPPRAAAGGSASPATPDEDED